MSNKKCIYKGCTNTGAGEVTLFSFPKDLARQNAWLELAGRPAHSIQKSDCICELHFGRQFISSNQRRKVLVGVALPFSFDQNESEIDEEQQIETLDDSDRLDIHEMFGHDDEHQEDMESYSTIENVAMEEYSPETIVCDDAESSDRKRKIIKVQNLQQNGSGHLAKVMKIVTEQCKQKNGTEATKPQLHRKDEIKQKPDLAIIDHPDVSIFNIRGEEFIQMPKSVYLEEKSKLESCQKDSYTQEIIKLKEELNLYKNIVHSIKNQLKMLP